MTIYLIIIAVLLLLIFLTLRTLLKTILTCIEYYDKAFNDDDLKILRYVVYDLHKIMPHFVAKYKHEREEEFLNNNK